MTGATGFVGRALCKYLQDKGAKTYPDGEPNPENYVLGLVHNIPEPFWKTQLNDMGCHALTFGDIRDFKRMREILYDYKPDAIMHLAAQAIISQAHLDPLSTYDVNVNGTISLLQAWREAAPNAQFVYFSTDKVYGNGLGKKETDPIISTNDPYQASKAAADIIAQSYGATVTRSCNIYGPSDREPSRLVPYVIQSCLRNEAPILRSPTAIREYIYVEDVCRVLGWMLENRRRGIWNIGSGKVVKNREVAKEIYTHFPGCPQHNVTPTPQLNELWEQSLDTGKLCGEMDCLAFTTLQAGIRKTVEYWRTQTPLLSSEVIK